MIPAAICIDSAVSIFARNSRAASLVAKERQSDIMTVIKKHSGDVGVIYNS